MSDTLIAATEMIGDALAAHRGDIPQGAREHLARTWAPDVIAAPAHLATAIVNGKLTEPQTLEVITSWQRHEAGANQQRVQQEAAPLEPGTLAYEVARRAYQREHLAMHGGSIGLRPNGTRPPAEFSPEAQSFVNHVASQRSQAARRAEEQAALPPQPGTLAYEVARRQAEQARYGSVGLRRR